MKFKAVESIENVYTAWSKKNLYIQNGCWVFITTQSYLVCHSKNWFILPLVAFCGSINTILYPLGLFRVLKLKSNMGHKPDDDIKGGGQGGSIKVGATGRVSSLMTRELESVSCGVSASSNEAGTRSNTVQRTQGSSIQGKMHSYHVPMLAASEDICVEKTTPVRGKLENKRSKLVEIVDLKCGRRKPEGKVCSSPIGKKLAFSRLSVSN